MKKIVLTLLCLVSFVTINAETASITFSEQRYTNAQEVKSVAINDEITLVFDKGSNSNTCKYYNTGTAMRVYGGGTMTVQAASGTTINSVTMITGSGDYVVNSASTVSAGTLAINGTTATISGVNGNEVVFTQGGSKGHVRIQSVTVDYTGGTVASVATPTFSLGKGTYYETQSVELSCATEDATIYYTIDGNEPDANSDVYTEAIQVAETTTIKAVAIKDEVSSNVATATFTIVEPEVLENIAAFYEIASSKGKAVKFANTLTVIYQNYNNLLVKDETGTMLIYGSTNQKYTNGDVMEAGTIGTISAYGGNPQLEPVSTKELPNAAAGTPVEPKEVTIAELSECSFLDYVKVEDVTFTLDSGKTKNYTISKDGESFAVYNQFNLTISNLGAGKLFDVTGFMSSYNGTVQLQPTSVEYDDLATGIEEIATENAPVEYYNLQGVKVARPENGIFIRKQGGKATKVVL